MHKIDKRRRLLPLLPLLPLVLSTITPILSLDERVRRAPLPSYHINTLVTPSVSSHHQSHHTSIPVTDPHSGIAVTTNFRLAVPHRKITWPLTMAALTDSTVAEDLDSRIQDLPQELQEMIMWFTDGFDVPTVVSITKAVHKPCDDYKYQIEPSYKPPIALQLNRKLRYQFAEKYYRNTMFVYIVDSHWSFLSPSSLTAVAVTRNHLWRWIQSLSKIHRDMIQSFELMEMTGIERLYQECIGLGQLIAYRIERLLVKAGVEDVGRIELVLAKG